MRKLKANSTEDELRKIFADYYRDSFFVRLVNGSPDINWVKTTNFCDIGFAVRGKQIVVFSAIDNLVKGAAGQAVQNMNLMFGLEETTGLMLVRNQSVINPCHPCLNVQRRSVPARDLQKDAHRRRARRGRLDLHERR